MQISVYAQIVLLAERREMNMPDSQLGAESG
jgi:hypothetical protein